MRDLLRRLEKLETVLAPPSPCTCHTRRGWIRLADEQGQYTQSETPKPEFLMCPIHGEVEPFEIVLRAIDPKGSVHP